MKHHRSRLRSVLQSRLVGLGEHPGQPPAGGWVRNMRLALGMSSYQLATRMGLSQTRVAQLEVAEVDGSIRLMALRRAAEAMSCTLVYALVPKEPLDDIVHRQAYLKAATQLSISDPDDLSAADPDPALRSKIDELEDLTLQFVDHRQLWS